MGTNCDGVSPIEKIRCCSYTAGTTVESMAKSDSFFIRAKLPYTGPFGQTSIDLGAYVDALGKSVLRIHNVSTQYVFGPFAAPNVGTAGVDADVAWQLTTQSQIDNVDATDKSVISTGQLHVSSEVLANSFSTITETTDINPQNWRNGYLVGVEQIYLGGKMGTAWQAGFEPSLVIVMECTVETLSQSAAMALALSQQ